MYLYYIYRPTLFVLSLISSQFHFSFQVSAKAKCKLCFGSRSNLKTCKYHAAFDSQQDYLHNIILALSGA